MLTSRVFVPPPPNPEQEDIFSSSLGTIFSDIQNSHGTPGQAVVYTSPQFGDISLEIPSHPDVEEGRKLFAHYLWNAAVIAAEAIEQASTVRDTRALVNWSTWWDVRNRRILELGAGTALPSLVAALCGARSTVITDHPSSPALVNDTIAHNVKKNLGVEVVPGQDAYGDVERRTETEVSVHGLTWGHGLFTNPFSYGKQSDPQPAPNTFDRMIVADCLWMPSQHANIVLTIDRNLRKDTETCALVVAGFHTGRSIVARFFEIATGSRTGRRTANVEDEEEEVDPEVKAVKGCLVAEEIFEIDVEMNVRDWEWEKAETKDEAKRWVVCAVLRRS